MSDMSKKDGTVKTSGTNAGMGSTAGGKNRTTGEGTKVGTLKKRLSE